jgi:Transcriptional regulators
MITVKEMADILGISTTTVNNVVHGRTKEVSKATIEKVQKLIEEYDYVPNMSARNLAQNKSKIIGVAMKAQKEKYDNALKDNYTGELVGAIEKCVRNSGYFMMVYFYENINEIIKYVSSWNVDGLILLGMNGDECLKIKKKFRQPMIFIDSYYADDITKFINVGLEDEKGSYEMTKYLLECGHKKIAFLADNCMGVDAKRFLGYRRALEEYNIEYTDDNFILLTPGEAIIESSFAEVRRCTELYTAFFCASDYYAAIVMNYLIDHGLKIPQDISIVGFDDNIYARIVRPALTTVHQDVTQKGEIAVERLLSLLRGEELEHSKIVLPVSLVIRDSVKKIG